MKKNSNNWSFHSSLDLALSMAIWPLATKLMLRRIQPQKGGRTLVITLQCFANIVSSAKYFLQFL